MAPCFPCSRQQSQQAALDSMLRPFFGPGKEKDLRLVDIVYGSGYLVDCIVAAPADFKKATVRSLVNMARDHITKELPGFYLGLSGDDHSGETILPSQESRDLPDEIIDKILTLLPVTTVYEISKSSKTFRDTWRYCSDFSLDKRYVTGLGDDCLRKAIVRDIIMGHSGVGARTFSLYFKVDNRKLVETWVKRVINLGFEDIFLDFSDSDPRRGPVVLGNETFMVSNRLRSLHLSGCTPMMCLAPRNSLPHLLSLTLEGILIESPMLRGVSFCCRSLQVLKFVKCTSVEVVLLDARSLNGLTEMAFDACDFIGYHINAPSVKTFEFSSGCMQAQLKTSEPSTDTSEDCRDHHLNLMNSLELCRHISRASAFLLGSRFAAFGNPVQELGLWNGGRGFANVQEFHLHARISSVDFLSIPLFLLRCPLLRRVFMNIDGCRVPSQGSAAGVRMAMSSPIRLRKLHYVMIEGMSFSEDHDLLVQFFAATSTSELKSLTLVGSSLTPDVLPNCFWARPENTWNRWKGLLPGKIHWLNHPHCQADWSYQLLHLKI